MDRSQAVNHLRLKHTINHIDEMISDLETLSLEEFKKSSLLSRATCFSLAQVGEQLDRLKEIYGEKHPEIPWNKSKSMRNRIVHDYVQINFQAVYETVKNDLPKLKEQLMRLLEE